MSNDAKLKFEELLKEEKQLEFLRLSNENMMHIGLSILEHGKKFHIPVAVEITLNGLVVFRHFQDGAIFDSEFWLQRKRNSVELMSMSSLRFLYWLDMIGETLSDRKLNPDEYAAGGGGFPIKIRGMGVVGSICVSGLPNHEDDHQIVVDAIKEYLETQKEWYYEN